MAGASLLALLDDITTVLDDVAILTKLAAKKTAGVLGDDLALNAEQVSGVRAEREIPVVWAVFKGSVINKVILVPGALLISALAPVVVTFLLMLGGLYLCFEGVEKVWHALAHRKDDDAHKKALHDAMINPNADLAALEKQKIKGAIRTDFVLSAEIIVIALGTVAAASFLQQVLVVSTIAAVMTVGVYGLVAGIVKLDDLGLWLQHQGALNNKAFQQKLGRGILAICPWVMRTLSLLGTAAMFLVGGGILVHGIPWLHHLIDAEMPFSTGLGVVLNFGVGIVAGSVAVLVFQLVKKGLGKH